MLSDDELRALAEALGDEDFELRDSPMFVRRKWADYLLACANGKPVAHYAMLDSHRRLVERAIDDAARPSGMSTHDGKARIDASILRRMLAIIDSSPAAPQAEPPRQAGQEISLGALMREQRQSRIVAGAFPDGNPAAKAMIAQTPQTEPCIGNDPACPCQDGDPCHYRDTETTKAWPIPQVDQKREPLSDEQIAKGDYVLATKWGDGDPGDHWGVGFYDRLHNGRHYVLDNGGKQIRGNGFRRVGRITPEMGRWLLSAAAMLESSPPGTVNLWTMLTERAHGIGGSDDTK